MAADSNVLAFVMAGGEGSRLRPLTAQQCKPAVPFNVRHRIVDFVLSNLLNSGIDSPYLLVQYKPQSLVEHIQPFWSRIGGVTAVAPRDAQVFRGTADAVFQNIDLIRRHAPEVVAVFGADHIYRMDVRQMLDFHRQSGADATVAAVPVCLNECHQFGIVETDGRQRITAFKEKPKTTPPMRGSESHALASMGNYIFNTQVLLVALEQAAASGATDFGKDILPAMVASHKLMAYDFHTNEIPGMAAHEEHGYWRDVGTIDAYYQAQLDTLGAEPRFSMHNPLWPIHGGADQGDAARTAHSVVGAGSRLEGTLLCRAVRVERGASLAQCIVMEHTRIGSGARLRRAIIDHDNDIPPDERIGYELEKDRQRFPVSDCGVVVVPAGYFPARPLAQPVVQTVAPISQPTPQPSFQPITPPPRDLLPTRPFLLPQRDPGRDAGAPCGMTA